MIDYNKVSKRFKPKEIKTLLIGESPPPNGKTYFYIPKKMSQKIKVENFRSLPATIFYHYFHQIPSTEQNYEKLLWKLHSMGIFLIDICDKPLKITDRKLPKSINYDNLNILISNIPKLKEKIKKRVGDINDKNIIFLLPRLHYVDDLNQYFPNSPQKRWIDFRLNR